MKTQGWKSRVNAGSNHKPTGIWNSFKLDAQVRKLEWVGQRIAREGRTLGIRARRWLGGGEAGGIRAENIVWIFGAGRTGSTWLSGMMGELGGHTVWFEPWVG